MRSVLLVIGFLACMGSAASAQTSDIESVITAQIDAFQNEDVEHAFSYASPTIQKLFGTPQNFGQMVRSGYPMVWNPVSVTFLRTKEDQNLVYQEVRFVDASGEEHTLAYEMVQISGAWKINAVYKIQPDDLSS